MPLDPIVSGIARDANPVIDYPLAQENPYVLGEPQVASTAFRLFGSDKIEELAKYYHIVEIAYDRWGAAKLSQDLTDAGYRVVPFGQGFASMSAPTKDLLPAVLTAKVRHGSYPVLRWMVDCMEVNQDPSGNMKPAKPDRGKSGKRIDGVVALIMAYHHCIRNGRSVYEKRKASSRWIGGGSVWQRGGQFVHVGARHRDLAPLCCGGQQLGDVIGSVRRARGLGDDETTGNPY
jgi:hypothetical protein